MYLDLLHAQNNVFNAKTQPLHAIFGNFKSNFGPHLYYLAPKDGVIQLEIIRLLSVLVRVLLKSIR